MQCPFDLPTRAPIIYAIVHRDSSKRYVGQTINPKQRFRAHRYLLRCGKHTCRHLQYAWQAYGPEAFDFVVLERCADDSKETLLVREQHWAQHYQSFNDTKGYNSSPCMAVWNRGRKATPEERAKLSRIRRRCLTPERLYQLRTMNIGRKFDAAFREKCRRNSLGHPVTKKTRRQLSVAQKRHQASLTQEERRQPHAQRMKVAYLISPVGQPTEVWGLRGFCQEYDLDRAALGRVLRGKTLTHKGWRQFKETIETTSFDVKDYR